MKAALIADDLTGTNNAGVLVAKQGLATISVRHQKPVCPDDCQVVCVDTDSRYVPAADARERVRAAAAWASGQGADMFCNRVDNLLRGNIGAELDGMFQHLGGDAVAVVAPAFPALGRLVVDGHLMVNGTPVDKNEVAANDPFAPVRHSSIAAIIADQMEAAVAHVDSGTVEHGAAALAGYIGSLAANGARVVIVDQREDAHIDTLAAAMASLEGPLFPVDPGPLSARYLRAKLGPDFDGPAESPYQRSERSGQKVLMAVGSVTPVTREQLRHVMSRRGVNPVRLDPLAMIGLAKDRETAINRAVSAALASAEQDIILLTTCGPEEDAVDLSGLASDGETTAHALSKRISDGLAVAAIDLIRRSGNGIGGCFASGGDVTASLFEAAGTDAIKIVGDVIPLTAHVEFMGGRLDRLQLVTKGGSIGDADAIELCITRLLQALK